MRKQTNLSILTKIRDKYFTIPTGTVCVQTEAFYSGVDSMHFAVDIVPAI